MTYTEKHLNEARQIIESIDAEAIEGMVSGIQLSSPSNDYDRAIEILSVVGSKGAAS